ncbi:hypothetical protein [Legionella sp. PC997]|uniref:hypothetical protein n=1 Tax=Legionella sp. PC997 TaxID=2755562 RepID=UPI0015F8B425|nr:hypothetical protein [Legionella sp. PC997]QMT60174.1 hypothetical protein HBNCFIEN_01544 [Legionella sp. PC997]
MYSKPAIRVQEFIQPQRHQTDFWSPNNSHVRAYHPDEVMEVISKKDGLGDQKQKEIPTLFFFDNNQRPVVLDVSIPKEVNKFHCRVMPPIIRDSNGTSDYDPTRDNPEGLKNILQEHSKMAMQNLKYSNPPHSLPVTIVYHFGMDSSTAGHVGTVALRIDSFDDPSKNEIMVINSLDGYDAWENAAVRGIKQSCFNMSGEPTVHVIKPATYPQANITQASKGMNGSCGAITAEMCCAISPNISFSQQKEQLVAYMSSICGERNEAQIRKQHHSLLHMPQNMIHPTTANVIVAELLVDPAKINNQNLQSGQLLKICKSVNDPKIIHHMLKSPLFKEAIQQQSGVQSYEELQNNHRDNAVKDREFKYISTPKTSEEFVVTMLSYPHFLASAKLQLKAANLNVYDVLSRVNDKNLLQQFFTNPTLAGSITQEQRGQLMSENVHNASLPQVNQISENEPSSCRIGY